jgi:hypothetical protein
MLALSTGPYRVGVFFPSPEDGSRSIFRKVVFSSILECLTMESVQKPSNAEYKGSVNKVMALWVE